MAIYEDFKPIPGSGTRDIYMQITDYLSGSYSVEVLPDGNNVILRVWHSEHCDITKHNHI